MEMRRLARLAYPSFDNTTLEQICMDEFINNLERKDLRLKLIHASLPTLDEVVSFCVQWEAIEIADRKGSQIVQAAVDTRSPRDTDIERLISENTID